VLGHAAPQGFRRPAAIAVGNNTDMSWKPHVCVRPFMLIVGVWTGNVGDIHFS